MFCMTTKKGIVYGYKRLDAEELEHRIFYGLSGYLP